MTPLRWLMEPEKVKLNGIAPSMPNQLLYSTILFANIVADEIMQLALLIKLTLHIWVLFSNYTKRPWDAFLSWYCLHQVTLYVKCVMYKLYKADMWLPFHYQLVHQKLFVLQTVHLRNHLSICNGEALIGDISVLTNDYLIFNNNNRI